MRKGESGKRRGDTGRREERRGWLVCSFMAFESEEGGGGGGDILGGPR